MSESHAATALTLDAHKTVSQPAFTLGGALRAPGDSVDSSGGQDQGDTVVFSAQGRAMAARQAQATEETADESDGTAAHIKQLKQRIAKLKQEIQQLQQDQTLTEDEKRQQVMAKQGELAELQTQLAEAYKEQAKSASSATTSAKMTSLGSYGAAS